MNIADHTILSISEVTSQVKSSLKNSFSNIWIKGEVSSSKTYPSGHIYLTLKDEYSELSAVIFSQYKEIISQKPIIGMEVLVMGDLSIYSPRGQFQLQIKNLYLHGEGELWLTFEKLKKRLTKEGLFDINHKQELPKYPQRIGVITSAEGAVLHDIVQIINRRSPYIKCYIYPVPAQGDGAAEKISEAIDNMNVFGRIDLLIIGRGGGSIEDLWCFNEEIVVRSIYQSKIPTISAVGHETDTTLSDYVADYRAPTPSVAAEISSVHYDEIIQNLDHLEGTIIDNINQKILFFSNKLNTLQKQHGFFKPMMVLDRMKEKLENRSFYFKKITNIYMEKKINYLVSIASKLHLLNPESQLKRGYTLAMDCNNKVIYDSDTVEIDDVIQLKFAKGKLITKVLEKE